jgi:CRISPR-associated endonuclease/helicase Cas3
VTWPSAVDERSPWSAVAAKIAAKDQVLCVVNLRRHAAELYKLVSERVSDGVFHLSTALCPAHRLDLLRQIRVRLQENRPCRVIATQLVEAGVDLDFPCVMRALGPLDSIAQAAGRCNREGKLTDARGNPRHGSVEVFIPEDDAVPSGVYRLATDKTCALLEYELSRGQSGPNIHAPASFDDYFRRLYADTDLDANDLQKNSDSPRRTLDFPETAARFELIPQATASVIVAYDDQARQRIANLRGAIARIGFPPAPLVRALQRYLVQRWPHEFAADQRENRVEPLAEHVWLWNGTYDAALGIVADEVPFDPGRWVV